ncbi:MAG: SIMPL domain-containing protein [Gemmatimonadaceae bacterium]
MLRTLTLVGLVTVGLAGVSGGQAGSPVPLTGPEIVASGRGEAKAAPTSASLIISVTTRAPTAAQAAADNATRLESTLRALRSVGLAPAELTTMGYSVDQNYEMSRDNPRAPAGFVARNSIRAEIRKLDDIGKVIDAALAGGATAIAGLQFVSATSNDARRSALADAVRQARSDAEAIARAAGGSLGRLISLSSGGPQMMRSDYDYAMPAPVVMASGGTAISPRDLPISAHVSGRWEFVPGASR